MTALAGNASAPADEDAAALEAVSAAMALTPAIGLQNNSRTTMSGTGPDNDNNDVTAAAGGGVGGGDEPVMSDAEWLARELASALAPSGGGGGSGDLSGDAAAATDELAALTMKSVDHVSASTGVGTPTAAPAQSLQWTAWEVGPCTRALIS
jgi:hypothetical protein